MNRDISILPEDIVRIIVRLLDPHIVTLLDKKYRDEYFKKYGISIHEISLSRDNLDQSLLQNYKINLHIRYGNRNYHNNKIVYKNTVRIIGYFIYGLEYYLNAYPNLVYISGLLDFTQNNLEKLRYIKNDLVLSVRSSLQLETIKKYTDILNLIAISNLSYISVCNLDGLESRITSAPSHLLKENNRYPNIEKIVLTESIIHYLEKNVELPRLKEISIDYYVLDVEKSNLSKKYPGVLIIYS